MCHFTFDILQIGVKLNKDGLTGRCMVDGVMLIQLLSCISFIYPLRSIIVYDFRLLHNNSEDEPQFEIFHQQEMWFVITNNFLNSTVEYVKPPLAALPISDLLVLFSGLKGVQGPIS